MKKTAQTAIMSDVEAIEYCLRVLYGHDQPEQAARLIERFGSAASVFDASTEELIDMGVTQRAAMFFTTAKQIKRQAMLRSHGTPYVSSPLGAAQYAATYFMNKQVKTELCVCLDNNYNVICAEKSPPEARAREAVALVCERNAQKVMFINYAPSLRDKRVLPSLDTQRTLIKLDPLLNELDVEIVDCIEYSRLECFSLRCAAAGKPPITSVAHADDTEYSRFAPLSASLNSYYTACLGRSADRTK